MRSLKIDTWPQSHEKVESIETTLSKFAACRQPGRSARPQHQIDIAKQVKRAGGRKLKIEAHGGARRRTFKDIEAAKYDSSDGERE